MQMFTEGHTVCKLHMLKLSEFTSEHKGDFGSCAYASQAFFPLHDSLHHFKEDGPREPSLCRGILVFHLEV